MKHALLAVAILAIAIGELNSSWYARDAVVKTAGVTGEINSDIFIFNNGSC
jgi:hypothetical protein